MLRHSEMKPTVYIETTVPSLLTAWPSRDVETAAQQLATREWWQTRRHAFELYVSPDVLDEAERGDADAARLRLSALKEVQGACGHGRSAIANQADIGHRFDPATSRDGCRAHWVRRGPWDGLLAHVELPAHPQCFH